MKAILVNRELSRQEEAQVQEMARKGGSVFRKGEYDISEDKKRQINYDTMDMVTAFGNKDFGGKSVVEWLRFDESSLWYYHKFRTYFHLRNLKYEIEAIKKLSGESERLMYYGSDPLLAKTELPKNVKISISGPGKGKKGKLCSLIFYALIIDMRWVLNLLSCSKLKKARHIILDVTKRQTFLDQNSLREAKGNYVIGYMLEKTGKEFLVLDEAVQPKMTDGARIKLSRENLFGKGRWYKRYFGEPILLKYLLSGKTRKRKKQISKELNRSIRELLKLSTGDDQLLLRILQSFRGASSFYLIKYLAYKSFFEKHSFETITTVDENSPAQRCILDAARINGIRTIGMQHGNIHDLHPAYIYTREDMGRNAVPDHNLIWGEYWKIFLLNKGNYPENSLHICGQVRTDVIPALLNAKIPRENIIPELGTDEKLIVFASQPQRDPELRKRAAQDVMKAVKAIDNGFLFIKLHPNERNDVAYYRNLANEAGLEKLKISLDIDLYLLISACDVLITCFSTVGTETVYFHKPLIILDHLKQDIQNYHREGVALQACNAKELEKELRGILDGSIAINKLAYKNYIAKYAHAIDGKASERALDVIERLSDLPI